MSRSNVATVDVRQMLCAQALAMTVRAIKKIPPAEWLEILYDAEDVKADLIAWAKDQGHCVKDIGKLCILVGGGH